MNEPYQHIDACEQSGVLVITLHVPRLDQFELCEAVGHEMLAALHASHCRALVVDMGEVEFIASVGVVQCLSVNRQVRERSGRMALCHLSEFLHEVFTTTRLLINPDSQRSPFEWAATRDEAVEMLRT